MSYFLLLTIYFKKGLLNLMHVTQLPRQRRTIEQHNILIYLISCRKISENSEKILALSLSQLNILDW